VSNSLKILLVIVLITNMILVTTVSAQNGTSDSGNCTTQGTNTTTEGIQQVSSNDNNPQTNSAVYNSQVKNPNNDFKEAPTVSIRPLQSEINVSSDADIQIYAYNPERNHNVMNCEVTVQVPNDVFIKASKGSFTGGAGTEIGKFSVPSGTGVTVDLYGTSDKVGNYPVTLRLEYWSGNNEDYMNPISLDTMFTVTSPSSDYHQDKPSTESQQNNQNAKPVNSGSTLLIGVGLIFAILLAALIRRN
jgi:hypothetical protein